MTRRWAAVMVGIMTVSMWAAPAAAQERMKYGVRAGVSAEPEQFFFGDGGDKPAGYVPPSA